MGIWSVSYPSEWCLCWLLAYLGSFYPWICYQFNPIYARNLFAPSHTHHGLVENKTPKTPKFEVIHNSSVFFHKLSTGPFTASKGWVKPPEKIQELSPPKKVGILRVNYLHHPTISRSVVKGNCYLRAPVESQNHQAPNQQSVLTFSRWW